MLALCLGFLAALSWGTADFVGGIEARRFSGIVVAFASQGLGVALLALVVLVASDLPEGDAMGAAAIAGLTGAFGLAVLYSALSTGTMSVVAPVAATGAIVPLIAGVIQGDSPSSLQVAGIAVVGAGVLLATRSEGTDATDRRASQRGIALALLAALCLGTSLTALDNAAGSGVLSTVFVARIVGVAALGLVIALAYRSGTAGVRGHMPTLALVGVLDTSALLLFALATTHGFLSVVSITTSLYPVVTVILARALLAERLRPIQTVGVTVAFTGLVLLVAGQQSG